MTNTAPSKATLSISSHLLFYIALYFIGGFVGFQGGWIIAIILTGLKIIQPPLHILVIFLVLIPCVYFPKLVFAKKVPALCPSCGGTAYLNWPAKPLHYVCANCGQIHRTGLSLRGR